MTEERGEKTSARRRTVYIAAICVMVLLIIAAICATLLFGQSRGEGDYLKLAITVIGMVFAAILFACCGFRNREESRQGDTFAAIAALLFFTILLSGAFDIIIGVPKSGQALFVLQTVTSVLSTVTQCLFWRYQQASLPKNHAQRFFSVWIYGIAALYLLLMVINLFTGVLFFVDASGQMQYPGEAVDLGIFALFYLSFLVYTLPQRCSRRKKVSLASFAFFPLLCVALTAVSGTFGVPYGTLSISYIFILLAAYVVFFGDYIESRELLLRQKAELAEQTHKQTELQTALMLSQIRPHFLYNALTAIRNLCKNDPAEAYTSLGLFADYLRGNMDALGNGRIVSFEKELEHVKTYLMLEQMRFGDELRVEYDIQYAAFSLPALTVQPIVENAVRHGATMNESDGMITIRSVKTDEGVTITVTDNGPGFNPDVSPADGRSHWGLKNVRACLATSGCGELHIDSIPGTGTIVTILIREEKA